MSEGKQVLSKKDINMISIFNRKALLLLLVLQAAENAVACQKPGGQKTATFYSNL